MSDGEASVGHVFRHMDKCDIVHRQFSKKYYKWFSGRMLIWQKMFLEKFNPEFAYMQWR